MQACPPDAIDGGYIQRERRLRRREDFQRVLATGRSRADNYLVLKLAEGTAGLSRIGLVTSKKVGGAVERNLVRRRLRGILGPLKLKPGADLVFIARSSAARAPYSILESSVKSLLKRAGLVMAENEETGS
ncbi:ribonuclease P protein component [Dehalogenimonas formicexedens]|uniref:Ribonuclease P protein component n=1 Tax=Dehalogenimonas formicexedens TaxID=1839801 RepID=A0A1P8F7M3_9CHLR|nr:ribonuclease P protein component [Dehalogenimonas formicexedens]APV44372.1 ribonuclease P protein component [Dehalogenimonas formicexedens]